MADVSALGTSAVLAALLVPAVSLFKRPEWPYQVNYLIGMAVALVCALAGAALDGSLTPEQIGAGFVTSLATAQTIYALYFSGTGTEEKLANK
jgi:hypothetical protein